MAYSVRLMRAGVALYTFKTQAPWVDPSHAYEHDDQQPPRLTAMIKTWAVEGVLYGANEAAVITLWDELKGFLQDRDNYPDGCELLRDGAVVDRIGGQGQAFNDFKISAMASPRDERGWRGQLVFLCTIAGRQTFADADDIVNITQSDSFSYDDRGLLTRTLSGEVTTLAGTSAVAKALGLGLALTGANFDFLTLGPGGVDVVQMDRGDTRATFTSAVQQSGLGLPAGVSPAYVRQVSTSRQSGEQTVTTTVSARGVGAEAAVKAEKPGGNLLSEVVTVDNHQRSASATYVTSKEDGGHGGLHLLRLHTISMSGGGRAVRFSRISGGFKPAMHVLSFSEVVVVETIRVEVTGTPGLEDFELPPPLDLPEDEAASISGPTRTVIGRERAGDKWSLTARRVYRTADDQVLPRVLGKAIFEDGVAAGGKGTNATETIKRGRSAKAAAKRRAATRGTVKGFKKLGLI